MILVFMYRLTKFLVFLASQYLCLLLPKSGLVAVAKMIFYRLGCYTHDLVICLYIVEDLA
jgi:hypothetical protein